MQECWRRGLKEIDNELVCRKEGREESRHKGKGGLREDVEKHAVKGKRSIERMQGRQADGRAKGMEGGENRKYGWESGEDTGNYY